MPITAALPLLLLLLLLGSYAASTLNPSFLLRSSDDIILNSSLARAESSVVVERLLSFITWRGRNDLILDEETGVLVSKVHFVYQKYPNLFWGSVFLPSIDADLSVGQFGTVTGGSTLLWRLLNDFSSRSDAFREQRERTTIQEVMVPRERLNMFLAALSPGLVLLTHRIPDRDLLDESLLNVESIRILVEYADLVGAKTFNALIPGYLNRILARWRGINGVGCNQSSPELRVFRILLNRLSLDDREVMDQISSSLSDLFDFFKQEDPSYNSRRVEFTNFNTEMAFLIRDTADALGIDRADLYKTHLATKMEIEESFEFIEN